ncbi:MAG: hypothetical protein MJY95_02115 [Bacteroidaceae bacterium]|nr:hypothetical protein [Bacteroidaceae bacterium]
MEKKSFLLPHCCQIIGWWLLGLVAVLCITFVIISYNAGAGAAEVGDFTRNLYAFGFYFLPNIALLLICLSREKEEDEYISFIRSRSVFIVVVFGFVGGMLLSAFAGYSFRMMSAEFVGRFMMYAQWFPNRAVLAIVYLLIFKGTLFVNKLKSRGNGE